MKFQKQLALKILDNHRLDNKKIKPLGDKAITAIKTMRSNLEKKGFSDITNKYLDTNITIDLISNFEKKINENVKYFYNGKPKITAEELFHIIQLWGGGEGRYIYVRGNGFAENFNLESYKNLINASFYSNRIEKLFLKIQEFNSLNKYINIAFITKHTRFLTSYNKTFAGLPIYDSEMSKNFMKEEKPQMKDLREYWRGMIEIAKECEISLLELERVLFNHARENSD